MVQSLWLFVLLSQIYFSESQNPVYHFINESKSWSEAQTFCREFYTDLATVRNMKDLERLRAAADGGTDPWTGLYQTSNSIKKWHWSQPEVQYKEGEAVWASGQPDDYKGIPENCGEIIASNEWNDVPCNVPLYFICYNESSNTTVLIRESKTWLEAQQFCRTHHTDLMSGLDQQGLFLATYPHGCVWCLIGLSRDNWGWSDGSDSSFRNWNTDVNPLTKKCATLTAQGRWESEDCGLNRPFICQSLETRKTLVKITMSSAADLNSLDDSIIQQLYDQLRANNLSGVKLSWKRGKDKEVFQRREAPVPQKTNEEETRCEKEEF